MVSLREKVLAGFGKLLREEQERILVERVSMPLEMARFRVALIRGEVVGDAGIETVYARTGTGQGDDPDRKGTR